MCGLTGFLDRRATTPASKLNATVRRMSDRLAHRGPDRGGEWVDEESGVAFGHRRLSIVDLSPAGNQPMVSESGRHILTYNGEIYNHLELRAELEAKGTVFRGNSDTEVMLAAFENWGISKALKRLIGMFAIALWDRQERTLTLARDHLGIKPIYWSNIGPLFLFGSELKSLRAHPDWHPNIDRNSVAAYMRHGYVPAPRSIWEDTYKLPAGSLLVLRPNSEPELKSFWSVDSIAPPRGSMSDGEAVDALEDLLRDAVKRQMVADVPLGAFLSGGIDSSTVVALMQAQSTRPVKTFSIGFHEQGYDEAHHAKAVAKHLRTDHTELYVTPEQGLALVPSLSEWYDEPFADSSQIPTYLVSRLARQDVTVALSGDGGDESFGGYNRYFYAVELAKINRLPLGMRNVARSAARMVPASIWDQVGKLIPPRHRPTQLGAKIHKAAGVLDLGGQDAIYRRLISQWHSPEEIVIGGREPKGLLWDASVEKRIPDFFSRMQYLDTLTYLPDDILTKVDRASMAVSLESRVPLLDHRVVEFARHLPHTMKVREGQSKWLLRKVLHRYVPEPMMERPKMGFGVPIDNWLRGPLRDWADSLLSREALTRHGLLHPEPVEAAWADHRGGQKNLQYPLWVVLMLQDWLDRQTTNIQKI